MEDDILQRMTTVFRSVLDSAELKLTPQTTAADVPGWDSLTHVQLVVAVEKQFKVKFTTKEIRSFRNVGEMCDLIRARQA